MFTSTIVALALSLASTPVATADEGLSGSEKKSFAKIVRSCVREGDAKKRKKLWKKAKKYTDEATPAQWEQVVRASYFGETFVPGYTKGVEFEALGEKWTYTVHMPSKMGKELLPLVIDPGHGSVTEPEGVMDTWMELTGTRESVVYIRTDIINKLSSDGRYDAWSSNSTAAKKPNMDTVAELFIAAIADASRRFPIDPDRVYVHGVSQTGFWTWYLGMHAPGRFAAIAPFASVTWHVQPYPENFKNVPIHIVHGTADATCPYVQAKQMKEKLDGVGADVTLTTVEGGPHTGITFGRWRTVWPEIAKKMRTNRYPSKIEATLLSPVRTMVHWLQVAGMNDTGFQIRQKPGRVKGAIEGNRITLEIEGPKEAIVWLSSEMVDLQQDVTVIVNGKEAFSGRAKPAYEAALELAIARGDGGAVYSAAVPIRVK
ncbi:MAG: hypothetical protein KDC38_17255 [Planctomycetes bacterium]|nr:hypothetical protein [Planctomycetota bacterium]